MSDKRKKRLPRAVLCSLFAAVICVIAPFAIPTVVPITLATLGIYVCACSLTPGMSMTSVVLYLVIGAAGVPVFSGFGAGLGKLAGPTGGYLVGYLPMALVISVTVTLFRKRRPQATAAADIVLCVIASVLGTIVLYAFGTVWYVIQQSTTFAAAIPACVLPFLPGDAAKIAAAALISHALRKPVGRVMER